MIFFTFSCADTVEEPKQQANEPSAVSDDYLLTNYWEGDGKIQNQQYLGEERIFYSKGGLPEGSFNCVLYFDLVGVNTDVGDCPSCVFAFQLDAQAQSGDHVIDDGTCTDYFSQPKSFHYAYTEDYQGHGPSLLYYSYDYFQWFAWIRNGDVLYGTEQVVEYDPQSSQFHYEGGFRYYFYELE